MGTAQTVFVGVLCEEFREKRGGKTGKLSPFHFWFTTSGDVISGDATSGRACAHDHFRHPHTAPPQIRFELSPYTTAVGKQSFDKSPI
jgi:hypothetical protein